jgi:hypothetical protein
MEATHFSETSVYNKSPWRHVPGDGILLDLNGRGESLKFQGRKLL